MNEETKRFETTGRNYLTSFAIAARQLAEWTEAFEQRGGADALGEDALAIVYLCNELQAWLTPERRATLARLRVDV